MREIKYRGMSLNGWVYGHYVVLVDKLGDTVDCIWELGASSGTPVERKSIGQFTGLRDNNGVEIYERGTLIKNGHADLFVSFEDGCFVAKSICRVQRLNWKPFNLKQMLREGYVSVDIYDHSHLLEE